jgi:hypothetical protein
MSDTLRVSGATQVQISSRDRITVDMRGMKGALTARARQLGQAPSEFVRSTLASALGAADQTEPLIGSPAQASAHRVRMCLRVHRSERDRFQRAAREAGLTVADLISGLLERGGVVDLRSSSALVDTLKASNGELAALSRSLSRLTTLLSQGSVQAALVYRDSLDRADAEVRAHLRLAAAVLSELQPLLRMARQRRGTLGAHDA